MFRHSGHSLLARPSRTHLEPTQLLLWQAVLFVYLYFSQVFILTYSTRSCLTIYKGELHFGLEVHVLRTDRLA